MICLALSYTTDVTSLLRSRSQAFYSSTRVSDAFALWWSVPTGFLGASAVWWAIKCGFVQLDHLSLVGRLNEFACVAWIQLHIIVYIALALYVRQVVRGPDLSKWRYEEASASLRERGIG